MTFVDIMYKLFCFVAKNLVDINFFFSFQP